MMRFYYVIGFFVLAGALLLLIPMPWTLRMWLLGAVLLILLSIMAWGAYHINSQLFVRSICAGNRNDNKVAITFDDGPHSPASSRILEILDRHACKASFFLTGSKLVGNEADVRSMFEKGHSIGNHSFSHSNLFPLFRSKIISAEIHETNRLLHRITGSPVRFFRPPFGVTNPRIYRGLRGLDMLVAGWSIRSFDTRDEPAEKVVKRIMKKVSGGDIILLHETSAHIIEILELLIPQLKKQDLSCVNMDQILD